VQRRLPAWTRARPRSNPSPVRLPISPAALIRWL